MSKQVDERIVSMQFDNKHFESNVRTTMSTLDKLKAKLHLDGASKGLENINSAAKKVDMNGLSSGIETVRTKFSALEVMGVTALANITNSAVNAGKRMVSALTIDPIKTGFQEYETQMGAVQTILANTQSKGSTLEDVNSALDELNKYADQTIYNFTEMTRNIGTFTAAGVDLDRSVASIKGIANLAAVSGSTSQQASTAMYQLSQALAAGKVSLMDWNSVVNAGMGGQVFQDALKRTSEVMGTGAEKAIKKYGSFRESLSKGGWLTADVLTETLNQFTMAAEEGTEQWNAYKKSLKEKGYTDEQATEILKMANTATGAATEVKTLTQLWDVMKESAQSGWAQTWKIIVGDFEEAKALLSPIASFLTGVIDSFSDARNTLLGGALDMGSVWSGISEKLENSGLGKIKKVAKSIEKATDKLTEFQNIVNKVWKGDYNNRGDNPDRFDLLEKEGYDPRVVQDLVNKGYGYKLTVDDIEASHKKFGLTMAKSTKTTKEASSAIALLSDEELKNAGLTDAEIKLYRDLAEESERTGKSIGELVDQMSKKDGRTLLIEALKNAGSGLIGIFKALKDAWVEIFPPMSVVRLYSIIQAINTFSEKLRLTDKKTGELNETGKKLQRTFKGIFALIDIITTIVGGGFKIAFKALTQLLGMFDMDILDLTAHIGDVLVGFRDWVDSVLDFTKVFEIIIPYAKMAGETISNWFGSLKNSEVIKNITSNLKNAGEAIREWLSGIKEAENIPEYIIQGLAKGLLGGISKISTIVVELAKSIITKICEVLDINSPSKVFIMIGGMIIAGLVLGLQNGEGVVWETLRNMGNKCIEVFKNIDFGAILAGAISIGLIVAVNKIANALSVFEGLGDMFEGFGEVLDEASNAMKRLSKAASLWLKSKAILNIAIAIGILAASLVALSFVKPGPLWIAVGAIAALAVIIGGLTAFIGKFGPKETVELGKLSLALMGLSSSILIIALAMKIVAGIKEEDFKRSLIAIGGFMVGIGLLMVVMKRMGNNIDGIGSTFIKLSVALLLIAMVCKICGGLSQDALINGAIVIGLVILTYGLLAIINMYSDDMKNVGTTLLQMAGAMLILTIVAKMIAKMTWPDMGKAAVGILGLGIILAGLIWITKIAGGKEVAKVGTTLLAMSGAIAILALTVAALGALGITHLAKGVGAVIALGIILAGLIWITKIAGGKEVAKVGTTLLAMSIAIGIMAASVTLLGFLSFGHLAKGLIAVAVLGAVLKGLIKATKFAQDCKGNLIVMTVAIGVMATAIAALSMIDGTKLAGATAALSIVMGMFASMTKAASNMQSAIGTLIVMTIAIGIMAGILYLLSSLPVESTIGTAIGLSILMGGMSIVLYALSAVGSSATNALLGVVGLLALCVPLVALVGVLYLMQNVKNATANALILAGLATALTLLLIPLTTIGVVIAATGGASLLGVVGLLTMCVPLVAIVGILALMQNIQNATTNTLLLTTLLTVMTGVLVALSNIGPLAMPGVAAMAALTGLILAIGVLAVGIGALMEKFPALQEFLDVGIPVLIQLASGVGEMIGAFIGGVLSETLSALPEMGNHLSTFMKNVTPFINGANKIKPEMVEGIKGLASAILIITATDVINGLTSWLTGGDALDSFGQQLPKLGECLKNFVSNLGTFDEATVITVNCAGKALKSLAEAAKNIPNEGGLWGVIVGENSLVAFGQDLPNLGKYLSGFVSNIGTFDEATVTTVDCAGKALKSLAEAAKGIPNEGGLWGAIVGENSLAAFGEGLPNLGKCLSGFVSNLGTFDEATVATVNCASKALKSLAEAAKGIPNEGGLWGAIVGENSLADFASKLPKLATNLKDFVNNLGSFDEKSINTVNGVSKVITSIANLGKNDLSKMTANIEKFGEKLSGFGSKLKSFFSYMSGITVNSIKIADNVISAIKKMSTGLNTETINSAADAIDKMIKALKNISGINENTASSFDKGMKKIGDVGIKALIKAFSDAESKLIESGKIAVDNLKEGSNKESDNLIDSFKTILADIVSAIKDYYDDFYSAGKYLVSGFAAGISANTYAAKAKAKAMASAAASAARKELDEHSPSKVGYEIGDFFGIAFVNAIGDNISKAYKTSVEMAKSARRGLSDTIGRLADVVALDMDVQPTIRPVLDLSDVASGAGAISSMFNMTPSVDVLSNVNAINSAMNRRQNGMGSADIVSAIKGLRKDIANMSSNTYNVNGVTYDDGSNIANAVEALVRATQRERRV